MSHNDRQLVVQLRALADAVTRNDAPPALVAAGAQAVARDLESFAHRYVSMPPQPNMYTTRKVKRG